MASVKELGLLASTKKVMKPRASMLFAFTASAALGTIIAGNGFPPIIPTMLAIISTFFMTMATYLYNDIIDLDMDKESKSSNKEDRPLVTGEVSLKTAYTIVAISSILGIATALLTNRNAFIFGMSFWVLFMLYSFPMVRFKRMFVIKTLVTSLGPALTLLFGMTAVLGNIYPLGIFTAIVQWAFLFLILPSIADSFDIEEDTKYGMRTMAMAFSWKTKARMLMFAPILATVASIIAYFVFNLSLVFPLLSAISTILYVKSIATVLNEYDEQKIWNLRKFAFIYYDLNLIYVLLGTLNISALFALI